MLLGGLVAGQGQIDVVTLIAHRVGLRGRRRPARASSSAAASAATFLVKHGPQVQITEERLQQVEGFFDRHGGKAILIGRFVGLVRAIAPFLAGSSGMPLRRFLPYDVVGAGLWGSTLRPARLRLLAELQHSSSTTPRRARSRSGAVIVLVVGDRVARALAARARRTARGCATWLERQAERPALRPLAARAARRSLRGSAAPGALRLGPRHAGRPRPRAHDAARRRRASARFVFVARPRQRSSRRGLLAGDATALRLADRPATSTRLVDVAKVVTALGLAAGGRSRSWRSAAVALAARAARDRRGGRARASASC